MPPLLGRHSISSHLAVPAPATRYNLTARAVKLQDMEWIVLKRKRGNDAAKEAQETFVVRELLPADGRPGNGILQYFEQTAVLALKLSFISIRRDAKRVPPDERLRSYRKPFNAAICHLGSAVPDGGSTSQRIDCLVGYPASPRVYLEIGGTIDHRQPHGRNNSPPSAVPLAA